MKNKTSLMGLALISLAPVCFADLTNLEGLFSSELEEYSAVANQATYDSLREFGCSDDQRQPTDVCNGGNYRTWVAVREIVHTANELTDSGPATFSLGLDLENLGFVLRWTAAEEFSTQGDMSSNFVRGQMAGLASRVSALRSPGGGLAAAGISKPFRMVDTQGRFGGGAAGSSDENLWSPWGFFMNVDARKGDRDATALEDAFDFDGVTVNAGIDYRINAQWVVGAMLGYQTESLQFDPRKSIAEGDVDMTGVSLQPFVLYSADTLYFSAAMGLQSMDFDTYRVINYPSFNPLVPGTDTAAASSTSASSVSFSSTLGAALLTHSAWGVEPFVSLDYRDVTVDGYTETDIKNQGFAFVVAEQSYDEMESALGVKVNYVHTPDFGVFIPFLDLEYRTQHNTDPRYISAMYVDAEDTLSGAPQAVFSLPTDKPDSNYWVSTLGVSAVVRGASQATVGAAASGGVQVFLQFRQYHDLEHYSLRELAAGFRYEF